MADIKFKLQPSLKRIGMIHIAEALWKSPAVINKINEVQPKLKLEKEKYHYMGPIDSSRKLSDSNYHHWIEEVIDFVLEKSSSMLLPSQVKTELQCIIILLGEKIFYFYDHFQESDEDGTFSWGHTSCKKCITAAKTEHYYSFSQHGLMEFKCPLLHLKDTSTNHVKKRHELFKDACRFCDVEVIEKYQNEIIAYLESAQPGLKLKNSKDVVLSIICAWYLMDPELEWERGYIYRRSKNGFLTLPTEYFSTHHNKSIFGSIFSKKSQSFFNLKALTKKSKKDEKDSNFIVPLEALPQMCTKSYPTALKYFANKLHSLNSRVLFSGMVKLLIGIDQSICINKRLHYHPAPDYYPEKMLYVLNLMTPDEKCKFLQENLNDLLMYFLPVWPFQELVLDILDFCFKKNLNLDYKFLLNLTTLCIEIQNKFKYKIQKQLHFEIFEKVWHKSPDHEKFFFLVRKTLCLINDGDKDEILKLLFPEEFLEKFRDINNDQFHDLFQFAADAVSMKWKEIFVEENFEFVKSFLSQINFSESFFASFINRYVEGKSDAVDIAFNNIFVV